MATYKVIQDIEAEDKLLGPLTLRQFIYAAIVAVSGFIAFRLLFVAWWLAMPLLPVMILFGVLAAPFGHDQPSEVWLLAKIRFFLKPRRRIWDQSGVKELVTITAPKRIERNLTNNLSQDEVRSRLQALANTIDSRGWAVKNVDINMLSQPAYVHQDSDRLIDASNIPQQASVIDVTAVDDMLDERNNPTAQHLDKMIHASAQNRREQLITQLQEGTIPTPSSTQTNGQQADYWFLNSTNGQPVPTKNGYAAFDHNPLVMPGGSGSKATAQVSADEERALLDQIHHQQEEDPNTFGHMKVIQPLSARGRRNGRHSVPEKTRAAHQKRRKERDGTDSVDDTYTAEHQGMGSQLGYGMPGDPMAQVGGAQQSTYTPQNTPMKTPSDPVILELANNDDLNVATIARQANKIQEEKMANGEVVIKLH
jgi:hypothetical protein